MNPAELNALSEKIIGAAIEVHRRTGSGLLESAYQRCLARELSLQGIPFQREVPLPIEYKGLLLDCVYRVDFLIDNKIVIEIKSVANVDAIHEAQLLTYVRLDGWKLGLIINFNVPLLVDGVRRRVLGL